MCSIYLHEGIGPSKAAYSVCDASIAREVSSIRIALSPGGVRAASYYNTCAIRLRNCLGRARGFYLSPVVVPSGGQSPGLPQPEIRKGCWLAHRWVSFRRLDTSEPPPTGTAPQESLTLREAIRRGFKSWTDLLRWPFTDHRRATAAPPRSPCFPFGGEIALMLLNARWSVGTDIRMQIC